MKRKWLFKILRYVLGLLIALLIGWGFYGFIKDDNWIAVSALATLVLAFAAVLTIRNSNEQEKRNRKERLLNEIIEWALDTAESALRRKTIQIQQPEEHRTTKMEYELSKAKSRYISEIVSLLFDDLSPFLKDVITKLDKAIGVITQYIKGHSASQDLRDSEEDLTESVEKLIVEVAKIKTKDIS